MSQRVSGMRVFQAACVKPLDGHNWSSTVSLNAQSYPLPFRVAHSSLQWLFDFFSLSPGM